MFHSPRNQAEQPTRAAFMYRQGGTTAVNATAFLILSLGQLIMHALIKNLPALFIAMSLIFICSCASTTKHEGTGEYVDDTVITARVKAAILGEPTLKVTEINVETFKGVVQLSGFVSATTEEQTAVKLAKKITGVKSVKNDMRVK